MIQSVYETDKLYLMLSDPGLALMVTDYYRRNMDFLAQFEPQRRAEFFTVNHQKRLLQGDCKQAGSNTGYRFWIVKKSDRGTIIGMVALNSIVWGAFQSCFLGYKLDKDNLRCGYMTQAVRKCVGIAFTDIGLHRIEANIMPRNIASLRVAEKAGFVYEGISKEYLCINGVWEDHIHMVIINHCD